MLSLFGHNTSFKTYSKVLCSGGDYTNIVHISSPAKAGKHWRCYSLMPLICSVWENLPYNTKDRLGFFLLEELIILEYKNCLVMLVLLLPTWDIKLVQYLKLDENDREIFLSGWHT